jgi:endonuclease YncB( thermonuclease family)
MAGRVELNLPYHTRTVPVLEGSSLKKLLLAALLFRPLAVPAEVLTGRVVRVVDGDTVYVLDAATTQHKVRLARINAPERGQPFGWRSRERMAELVAGKHVEVDWYKEDRWGRLIGTVWVASPDCREEPCPKTLDAGLALVTSGLAWHFKRYAHEQSEEDRERYAFAEEEARAKKAGLWRDPDPIPPWEWRRR